MLIERFWQLFKISFPLIKLHSAPRDDRVKQSFRTEQRWTFVHLSLNPDQSSCPCCCETAPQLDAASTMLHCWDAIGQVMCSAIVTECQDLPFGSPWSPSPATSLGSQAMFLPSSPCSLLQTFHSPSKNGTMSLDFSPCSIRSPVYFL